MARKTKFECLIDAKFYSAACRWHFAQIKENLKERPKAFDSEIYIDLYAFGFRNTTDQERKRLRQEIINAALTEIEYEKETAEIV